MALIIGLVVMAVVLDSKDSSAIPVFARKYKTSCYTCHAGYPTLNSFGKAFKSNGYRWPGGEGADAENTKIEQTPLGAESYKRVFPDAPYPADMPGFAPIGFWAVGPLLSYEEKGATNGDDLLQWGGGPGASRVTVVLGGTVGENIGIFAVYRPSGG